MHCRPNYTTFFIIIMIVNYGIDVSVPRLFLQPNNLIKIAQIVFENISELIKTSYTTNQAG